MELPKDTVHITRADLTDFCMFSVKSGHMSIKELEHKVENGKTLDSTELATVVSAVRVANCYAELLYSTKVLAIATEHPG